MTIEVYCVMYLLLFAAAIKLRYSQPDTPRRIPGPNWVMWLVAGAGLVAIGFAFVVGFVPPSQIQTLSPLTYVLVMAGGTAVLTLPPFLFYRIRKPSWMTSARAAQPAPEAGS